MVNWNNMIYLTLVFSMCFFGSALGQCAPNWVQHAESCYHFSHDIENWPDAMIICIAVNAYIVEINDADENQFILDNMNATDCWIGLSDLAVEGKWKWMHSQTDPAYTNWASLEPNNGHENENCAMIRKTTVGWNDYECKDGLHYICEQKLGDTQIIG